jgi:hypothetical protein
MKAKRRAAYDVPFVVVCRVCGDRMELATHDDALLAGWTCIRSLPRCQAANFEGLCSACCHDEQEGERR